MQALTINLPDTAYRAAMTLTPHERDRLISAFFVAHADFDAEETETETERAARFAALEEADIQAVGRGIADMEAGRTVPGDVVFAQMREQARTGKIPGGLK